MKKLLLYTLFTGLMIGPFAHLQGINNEDLQKISANKIENKALENGQALVGGLATLALISTGCFGIMSIASATNPNVVPVIYAEGCGHSCIKTGKEALVASVGLTVASGAAATGLITGWYKLFKKRAERHGYKDNLLKFWFVDWMSHQNQR
jgi:hypothetical protein